MTPYVLEATLEVTVRLIIYFHSLLNMMWFVTRGLESFLEYFDISDICPSVNLRLPNLMDTIDRDSGLDIY